MTITIKSSGGLSKLIESIKQSKKQLNVGFLNEKNAIIATKNEYGGTFATDKAYKERGEAKGITVPDQITIPARPFMQMTFNNNQTKWAKILSTTLKNNNLNVDLALNYVGDFAKADIRDTIEHGNFVENSARTIAIKGNDHPLIDSGEMMNSIDYEVL